MHIAFFGSSLLSSLWNGAATYYRGLIKALDRRGHRVTFFEPDVLGRGLQRDIAEPRWAKVVVWPADAGEAAVYRVLDEARTADVVVVASGIGAYDRLLEHEVALLRGPGRTVAYWDVDAPATLERVAGDPLDPFRADVPRYDVVFTYGGGPRVREGYARLGARACVPIHNGLDPEEHHPVAPRARFAADLAFLGNRLSDREARVHEFLFAPARALPHRVFTLGGSGWDGAELPTNVAALGHLGTADHNAFHCSALAVLSVNRDSMARFGWSPATRVFEATGAGACLISDAWPGMEDFFEPGEEVLLAADGDGVVAELEGLAPERAARIGRRARARALAHHTYDARAAEVEAVLANRPARVLAAAEGGA